MAIEWMDTVMANEFNEWLKAEIEQAKIDISESKVIDMNCYGAGYDSGYLNALMKVKEYLEDVPT